MKTTAEIADGFVARRAKRAKYVERTKRTEPAYSKPPAVPRHERMPITKEQIETLLRGAEATRDRMLVLVCRRALAGEEMAINACKGMVYGLG